MEKKTEQTGLLPCNWQKLIPDAEFITILGAGHEVNIDCPSKLGEKLDSFFE